MRFFSLFLSILVLSAVMSAQKRYLVSPNDEVIPIEQGKGALQAIDGYKARMLASRNGVCSNKFYFGYPRTIFPAGYNFGAYHKDVLGQWFTAKATGTIDTLFWDQYIAVNAYDSTIYVRIHESYIGPDYGPGVRPGPFSPPCANWGYWVNTNDQDQGVAAFIEDATDTSWVSTINFSAVESGPPFGNEIWGSGGFPTQIQSLQTEWLDLGTLGAPQVTVGDKFFVSHRVGYNPLWPSHHLDETAEGRTEWYAAGFLVNTSDEDYPSRNWKFYEHDKGPSNCGGTIPIDSIKRGWVARGGFEGDTLNVGVWSWWYAMSVTSNVGPTILSTDDLPYSFNPGAKTVQAVIEDCNPANPGGAGVASAILRYSVDDGAPIDIAMDPVGGDVFEAIIPAQAQNSSVTYRVLATDLDGATGQGPPNSYRLPPYGTEWYSIDSSAACVTVDISSSGTSIDTSAFFNPYYTGSGTAPKDDGTAGPFDMGADFTLFGDTYRYAWIGVNGALALSKSATDTLDVNSNGFATTGWDLPGLQHHGRTDTFGTSRIPPMFIAPMWADHILGDTAGVYGRILYGDAGDTCLFVAQWDSVGAFDDNGSNPDITTFRAVLNKCTGVVEFQYEDVGTYGLDTLSLIGMQQDSTAFSGPDPGWIFVNRNGEPTATTPYNGQCFRLYPRAVSIPAFDGWNMIAVSANPAEGNYAKSFLFPSAVSPAYRYAAGYTIADPLGIGEGYWLKFSGDGEVGIPSSLAQLDTVTASVVNGWNMIGGPDGSVATGSIAVGGGATVTSSYFGYGTGGYFTATTIDAGQGYWVKTSGAGTLQMVSSGAVPKASPLVAGETDLGTLNAVTISDAAGRSQTLYIGSAGRIGNELSYFELPPSPPAGSFDVRFASQRMVESYPDMPAEGRTYDYPVSIQGAVYPVTVRWEITSPVQGARKLVLSDVVDGKSIQQVMDGAGSFTIKSQDVKSVAIRLSGSGVIPTSYALSQNYPNPFNPVTRFTVDLPKASEVEVAVFDLLGQKIVTLLNGSHAAGQYTLQWDARDASGMVVPTGMYFLRMSSGEFNATQKIMLMK